MWIASRTVYLFPHTSARRLPLALAVLLVLPCLLTQAKADDKAARAELDTAYVKVVRATKARDANALIAMATPDLTVKIQGRTLKADEAAKVLVAQFKMFKSVSEVKMHIRTLTVKGGQAVALVDYSIKAEIAAPDGKSHAMADSGVTRDTWVKTAKGWRLKAEETVSQNTLMDGKPIPTGG